MIYQTDFENEIRLYGCLFFSLINIALQVSGKKIVKHDVDILYTQLIDNGCMNKNCYIKNHTTVLNLVLDYLGSSIKMKYNGAYYLDKPNKSWGDNKGGYIIYQVKAPKFSHFRMMEYDPWNPTLMFNSIMSVRYYSIV